MIDLKYYCDLNTDKAFLSQELISSLDTNDVVVFVAPGSGDNIQETDENGNITENYNRQPGVCMARDELEAFWQQRTGWNFGNCHDSRGPVDNDDVDLDDDDNAKKYCNKYYKIPKTGEYIGDAAIDLFNANPTIQVWKVFDSEENRDLGIGGVHHIIGAIDRPNERIYGLCPEGTDVEECDAIENLVDSDIYLDDEDDVDYQQLRESVSIEFLEIMRNEYGDEDVIGPISDAMWGSLTLVLTKTNLASGNLGDIVEKIVEEYVYNLRQTGLTVTADTERTMTETLWDELTVVQI